MDFQHFCDAEESAKEKKIARDLRRTRWWKNKISGGICEYCGENVGNLNLTMDHIVPLSRGGKSVKNNIAASCKDCNNKKKYLLPMEWEDFIKKR